MNNYLQFNWIFVSELASSVFLKINWQRQVRDEVQYHKQNADHQGVHLLWFVLRLVGFILKLPLF